MINNIWLNSLFVTVILTILLLADVTHYVFLRISIHYRIYSEMLSLNQKWISHQQIQVYEIYAQSTDFADMTHHGNAWPTHQAL